MIPTTWSMRSPPVFGVSARAGQSVLESLAEFLQTKQLLLVVDNCEHVLDAVADLVEEISGTCPRVVVLATSREGLALDGERMFAVPALAAPAADADLAAVGASDAVQLFVERARAADADFVLGAANGPAVGQVCRRLDGVPLGDRVGGRAGDVDEPGGVGLGVGSTVRPARRGAAAGGETPADVAGHHRLVL